jgi:hypothetical protein
MSDHIHRFIVPLKGVNTFCTFRDGEIVPANPLPMVGYEGHAIDEEFGWVAWVTDDRKQIGRTHLDAVEGEGGFAPLRMPEGYTAGCLLFHRQVLFVGGECGKDMIGSFDLRSPEPKWTPLEVPEQFRQYGKRMDDLLLDGDRLIVVDNCIEPKYLLRYDVSDPRSPRLLDTRDLPVHSTYETVYSAALGSRWMALLSRSCNHAWLGVHIAVYDRETLEERGAMTGTGKGSYRGDEGEPRYDWRQLALHENTLLVAAGIEGIGVLDLDTVGRSLSRRVRDAVRRMWGRTPTPREFGARCFASLRYQPLPARYVGSAVARIVPMRGSRHYLAVVDTEPGYDTVVMELP